MMQIWIPDAKMWFPSRRKIQHYSCAPSGNGSQNIANKPHSSAVLTYKQTIEATAGVTHFYPLNETSGSTQAVDAVGSFNSTAIAGVTFGGTGGGGDGNTCAVFAQATSNGILFTGDELISVASSCSFELAFKMTTVSFGALLSVQSSGGIDLQLTWNSSSFLFLYNNGVTYGSSFTPTVNVWYYVQFYYDSTIPAWKLYVNGTNISSGTSLTHPTGTFASGIGYQSGGRPIAGSIQDVSFYNVALSTAVLSAHYSKWLTG